MNDRSFGIQNADRNLQISGLHGWIVEASFHGNTRRSARLNGWRDVHALKRYGRHIDKIQVAIDSAVEIEVAEIGWNQFEISRIVAEDRDWDFAFSIGILQCL